MVGSAAPNESTGPRYAGFWRRASALVIDLLLLAPLLALHYEIYRQHSTAASVLSGLALGLLALAYPIYFHARWGQTAGKMVARIKVVRLDGTPITLQHALRRNAVDLVLWAVYASSTLWVLATWPSAEWAAIDRADQARLLAERAPLAGTFEVARQVWMWSELLVLLFNEKRRALHDFIAGTVVVRTSSPPSQPRGDTGT